MLIFIDSVCSDPLRTDPSFRFMTAKSHYLKYGKIKERTKELCTTVVEPMNGRTCGGIEGRMESDGNEGGR